MPKVWNKRDPNTPKDAVYVGRPSKWGNPYSHLHGTIAAFKVDTRDEAVEWFEKELESNSELTESVKRELKGKDLVCWCAPKRCHADILVKVANG